MKPHEQELRNEIAHGFPFTLVTSSEDRIRVPGHDWIFLPPLQDDQGNDLEDDERSDFFQVWGKWPQLSLGVVWKYQSHRSEGSRIMRARLHAVSDLQASARSSSSERPLTPGSTSTPALAISVAIPARTPELLAFRFL
jgi:hypothetical protein